MNSSINARSTATATQFTARWTALRASMAPVLRQPWFLCALVLMVALMSTFVHVLNGQVERGERLRADGMPQLAKTSKASASQLMAQAGQQPAAMVSLDTGR